MSDADKAADAWAWVTALEAGAPDIVSAWNGIEPDLVETVQQEARRVAHPGSTASLVDQLGALAEALGAFVAAAPDSTLRLPGGEDDWNVAQTIGHACDARADDGALHDTRRVAAVGRLRPAPGDSGDGYIGIGGRRLNVDRFRCTCIGHRACVRSVSIGVDVDRLRRVHHVHGAAQERIAVDGRASLRRCSSGADLDR